MELKTAGAYAVNTPEEADILLKRDGHKLKILTDRAYLGQNKDLVNRAAERCIYKREDVRCKEELFNDPDFNPQLAEEDYNHCVLAAYNLSIQTAKVRNQTDYTKRIERKKKQAGYIDNAQYFKKMGNQLIKKVPMEKANLNGKEQYLWLIPKATDLDHSQAQRWWLSPLSLLNYLGKLGTNTVIMENTYFDVVQARFATHCNTLRHDMEQGWCIRLAGVGNVPIVTCDLIRRILARTTLIQLSAW